MDVFVVFLSLLLRPLLNHQHVFLEALEDFFDDELFELMVVENVPVVCLE